MTTVYLWNDLPLFGMNEVTSFEEMLSDICASISTDAQEAQLIGFDSWSETVAKLIQISASTYPIVTIGSRPGRSMKAIGQPHMQLPVQRLRTADGATTGFQLVNSLEAERQLSAIGRSDLMILEDVIMTGRTFSHIDGVIERRLHKDCRVTWVVLFSAQATRSALLHQFGRRIVSRYIVAGRPAVDFTVMCLSDLLYGSIGNTRYRDNKRLLDNFFSCPIETVLTHLENRVPSSIEEEYHAS